MTTQRSSIHVFLCIIAACVLASCGKTTPTETHQHNPAVVKDSYYCPMHPSYTADKPGDCPICGMKLVKKVSGKETAAEGSKSVYISPDQQQLVGIKTQEVQRRQLTATLRLSGTAAYDPELFLAQKEYLQAVKANELAQKGDGSMSTMSASLLEAARTKLQLLGISDTQIEQTRIKGEPDITLFLTQESPTIWAYLTAYEGDVGSIKEGQAVTIESPVFPGITFAGLVKGIAPVIDPVTRSFRVRVEVQNADHKLKPGMLLGAVIQIELGVGLAIPAEALVDTGERMLVFVASADGHFTSREIAIGRRAGDDYEVTAGLNEGEQVVSAGNFFVDSESRLKSAINGETP